MTFCHSERSEESQICMRLPRFARNDKHYESQAERNDKLILAHELHIVDINIDRTFFFVVELNIRT